MKSIIIASVSAVCVLAIVLGCVFGIKPKKPHDNGPDYFLMAHNEFAEVVSSANLSSGKKVSTIGLSCSQDVIGDGKLKDYGEDYFIVVDENGNDQFYVFSEGENAQAERHNLSDESFGFVCKTEDYTNYNVVVVKGD